MGYNTCEGIMNPSKVSYYFHWIGSSLRVKSICHLLWYPLHLAQCLAFSRYLVKKNDCMIMNTNRDQISHFLFYSEQMIQHFKQYTRWERVMFILVFPSPFLTWHSHWSIEGAWNLFEKNVCQLIIISNRKLKGGKDQRSAVSASSPLQPVSTTALSTGQLPIL